MRILCVPFLLMASFLLMAMGSEPVKLKTNETAAELASSRKDGRQASSVAGGGQGLQSIQQGIKGIQTLQKLVSKLSNMIHLPFSFRGVSDTMATITGLLAAVGGGYLTYVSMVALFGNAMDPAGTALADHGYFGPAQPPYRRRSGSNLHIGSLDLGKVLESIRSYNYPEATFKMLRIKDEVCRQRVVCELEKFLAKKGIASVILKGVSRKITGMEKYLDAAYRGLANEDCAYAYSSCPHSLGQSLLRSVGLS